MLVKYNNVNLTKICKLITRSLCDPCKINPPKLTSDEIRTIEMAFEKVRKSNSKSLLKKNLTPSIFESLKSKQTSMGSNLLDCIQSGVQNLDSGIGVYAADEEAYSVFKELFDGIISDYHGFKPSSSHPKSDWGTSKEIANLDPEEKYIVSTRARCGRSIVGFPFNPSMTEKHYLDLEQKATKALASLKGELQGKYHPLVGMKKEEQQKLIDDHFLFKEGDRFLQAAKASRFWPTGRGIFFNEKKTILVWVNEEDHLRIISMQKGGDLKSVYERLMQAAQELEKILQFSRSSRFGYLTFCPTNLGTSIRASVHIKLPKLASDKKALDSTAAKYSLQVRGTSGEHTESKGGVYDISNKRRLGLTELEAIKEMSDGISALIKIEKGL